MIIITGIKMKIGSTSDLVEAFALGHMNNDIHIYSNSWGPRDWGFTVSPQLEWKGECNIS